MSDRPQPGWKLIFPGCYVDQEEQMHLFLGEALEAFGYQDNQANRETLQQAMVEIVRQRFGADIPISVVESGE